MRSPKHLSSCAFVDENPVMAGYSDLINGRCMEKLYVVRINMLCMGTRNSQNSRVCLLVWGRGVLFYVIAS